MKGFVLKDLFLLGSIWRNYLPMILIYAVISAFSSSASILTTLLCLLIILIPTTTFTYDEAAKWDMLALTMPVRRSQIVGAKYAVSLLIALVGTVITALVMFAVSFFPTVKWDIMEQLPALPAGLAVALVVISIMLPLLFKFGIAKARITLLLVMAAMGAAILLFSVGPAAASLGHILTLLSTHISAVIALSFVFVCLVMLLSYRISCRIYQKKEF
ncbi:MAG TPA: ABC-2 transporter permease [Oscillospiraceae bacterium]|nr:ABC-2 transporter permease [Oscillospiraceae bacterium]